MPTEPQKTDKQIRDKIVSKAMAKIRDRKSPPPQRDLVVEARELLSQAASRPWKIEPNGDVVAASGVIVLKVWNGYDNGRLAAAAPELLRQLCDEVERLRKANKSMADELGHQDSYWDDPLRGNFKC